MFVLLETGHHAEIRDPSCESIASGMFVVVEASRAVWRVILEIIVVGVVNLIQLSFEEFLIDLKKI